MPRSNSSRRGSSRDVPPNKKKNKSRTDPSDHENDFSKGNNFLYKLIIALLDIVTSLDSKSIQNALHDLSDVNKTSPVLLAVSMKFNHSSTILCNDETSSECPEPAASSETFPLTKHQSIGYLVVLATHTLQRLAAIPGTINTNADSDETNTMNPDIIATSWIAYFLSMILATAKLEKFTSSSSPGSRQIYGRALLACTAAVVQCLRALTNQQFLDKSSGDIDCSTENFLRKSVCNTQCAHALQVCILALDNVTLQNSSSTFALVNPLQSCPTGSTSSQYFADNPTLSPSILQSSTTVTSDSQRMSFLWNDFKRILQQNLHSLLTFKALGSMVSEIDWQDELNCLDAISKATTFEITDNIIMIFQNHAESSKTACISGQLESSVGNESIDVQKGIPQKKGRKATVSAQKVEDMREETLACDHSDLSTLNLLIQKLLESPQSQIKLDGRLAIKRWTAVAFTWYCHGHMTLMNVALALLCKSNAEDRSVGENDRPWSKYMDLSFRPSQIVDNVQTTDDNPMSNRLNDIDEILNETIPGNVVILWLVGRLIRIVREVGTLAGSRPPSLGGLDSYMTTILQSKLASFHYDKSKVNISTRHRKKRSRISKNAEGGLQFSNKSSIRSGNHMDIKELAIVVSYNLIEAHYEALALNFQVVASKNIILVINDDIDIRIDGRFRRQEVQNHVDFDKTYFYPFLSQTIEEISLGAASANIIQLNMGDTYLGISGSNSSPSIRANTNSTVHNISTDLQREWSDRIEFLSVAYIFQAQCRSGNRSIIDSRLLLYAVNKLNTCLFSLLTQSVSDNALVFKHDKEKLTESSQTDFNATSNLKSNVASLLHLMQDFHVEIPLPVPKLKYLELPSTSPGSNSKKTTKRRKRDGNFDSNVEPSPSESSASSVTMNPDFENSGFLAGEKLSLLLRSFHVGNEGHIHSSDSLDKVLRSLCSCLISYLMLIVEACVYDGRSRDVCESDLVNSPISDDPTAVSKAKAKQRVLGTRKRKGTDCFAQEKQIYIRRDKSSTTPLATLCTDLSGNDLGKHKLANICLQDARALVASAALDTLHLFLRTADSNNSEFTLSLRDYVGLDVINRLLNLTDSYNEASAQSLRSSDSYPTADSVYLENAANTSVAPIFDRKVKSGNVGIEQVQSGDSEHNMMTSEFMSSVEGSPKILSHTNRFLHSFFNVCIAMGGGGNRYYPEISDEIFGSVRHLIYKRIATSELQHYSSAVAKATEQEDTKNTRFPIRLSRVHYLLLASNLICESISNSVPDLFIVEGMINAISREFISFQSMWLSQSSFLEDSRLLRDKNKLLSIHDTRIFLLAFSRLGIDEKERMFTSLLDAAELGFTSTSCKPMIWSSNIASNSCLVSSRSIFLARVVILCTNAYVMIKFDSFARKTFCSVISKELSSELASTTYGYDDPSSETCFMDVFSAWNEIGFPSIDTSSPHHCSGNLEWRLEAVLECSLKLGFVTAPCDKCILLFSAWNCLGNRELWLSKPVEFSESIPDVSDDVTILFLQLRDDICLANRLIRRYTDDFAGDLLLRFIVERDSAACKDVATQNLAIGLMLRGMVVKASSLIDLIADKYNSDDVSGQIPVPSSTYCLLEALTIYISFAMAMHTIPKNDFFHCTLSSYENRCNRRNRAYSSDSEGCTVSQSEIETRDALSDTISRIQDVCDAAGAVPAHPDWLDVDCKLWDGITFKDAADNAERALGALTKISAIGLNQSQLLRLRALGSCSNHVGLSQNPERILHTTLALNLCFLQKCNTVNTKMFEKAANDGLYAEQASFIGSLCGVDVKLLESILSESMYQEKNKIMEEWWPHSSQRVFGRCRRSLGAQCKTKISDSELRCYGEWETILSGALASASLSLHEDIGNLDLVKSERWLFVGNSAIEAMVQCAALLRYSLVAGERPRHPLSYVDQVIDSFELSKAVSVDKFVSSCGSLLKLQDLVSRIVSIAASSLPLSTNNMLAAHLLKKPESFYKMQGSKVSMIALQSLADLHDVVSENSESQFRSASLCVELIVGVLENFGTKIKNTGSRAQDMFHPVVFCFFPDRMTHVDTFFSETVDAKGSPSEEETLLNCFDAIKSDNSCIIASTTERIIRHGLVPCLWHTCKYTDPRSRAFFLRIVSELALLVFRADYRGDPIYSQLVSLLITSLNNVCSSSFSDVIFKDLIGESGLSQIMAEGVTGTKREAIITNEDTTFEVRERWCQLLCLVIGSKAQGEVNCEFVHSSFVLDVFVRDEVCRTWMYLVDIKHRNQLLLLVTVYACHNRKLCILGETLVSNIHQTCSSSRRVELDNILTFFTFVNELRSFLLQRSETAPQKRKGRAVQLPLTCSFAKEKDFHEQHWYNCYTCGLIDDKGCCSLCAVECHRDHDVSYSRFSSFFCDCGAPYDKDSTHVGKQVDCICLKKQPFDKTVKKINTEQQRAASMTCQYQSTKFTSEFCVKHITDSFPEGGKFAMNDFEAFSRKSKWANSLLRSTQESFRTWKLALGSRSTYFVHDHYCVSYECMRLMLSTRSFLLPSIIKADRLGLEMSGVLSCQCQDGLTAHNTVTSGKKNLLENKKMSRSVLDGDSRGRIAIAENGYIIFYSLFPSLCSEIVCKEKDSSVCILGSVPIDFEVIGLRFSTDNNNLVVAWGSHDAKVILMNDILSTVQHSFGLGLETKKTTDIISTPCVINCHWLIGSPGLLAVCSNSSLYVFDVNLHASCSASLGTLYPCKVISQGTCDLFCDFVVVPDRTCEDMIHGQRWKIFMHLKTGCLHEIFVVLKCNDIFLLEGHNDEGHHTSDELKLNKEKSLSLTSTYGVQVGETSDLRILFLQQSRLLIFQSGISDVLGVLLDDKGSVKNTFVILTHKIEARTLGRKEESSVQGPYTHWTEVGLHRKASSNYFRVTCYGRCTTSGESVLLCISFNETTTLIEVLPSMTSGVGLHKTMDIYGSAGFSFPFAKGSLHWNEFQSFQEKVCLCTLSSNGDINLYCESTHISELMDCGSINKRECLQEEETKRLLAFEQLTNVSDFQNVEFHSVGLGSSESIKEKLAMDSDMYLMGPKKTSFILIISQLHSQRHTLLPNREGNCLRSNLRPSVFAGIRIHVGGKTVESIPSVIKVHGRKIKTLPRVTKWYSVALTPQEIALSVRNGFLAIEVGVTHTGDTNPGIDALELYSAPRKAIEKWLPLTLESIVPSETYIPGDHLILASSDESSACFRIGLVALGQLASMMGNLELGRDELFFVKQIIQETFHLKDQLIETAVQKIIESLFDDYDSRQSFHDKAVLSGCSNFLRRCRSKLENSSNDFQDVWNFLSVSLRTCLQTSAKIARLRAYNYLQAADETPHSFGSIATDASKFLVDGFDRSQLRDILVFEFVELCLLEKAVAIGSRSTSEYSPRGEFGSLDGLREVLSSRKVNVVTDACSAISSFCQKYALLSSLDVGEVDLFTAQTMEVKYACDSCTRFIDDVRFTLLDDNHPFDLCTTCYEAAKSFALANEDFPHYAVNVNGKSVGDDPTLSCGELNLMKPVAIKKAAVFQGGRHQDGDANEAFPVVCDRQVVFDEFLQALLTEISLLLERVLIEKGNSIHTLARLSVDLLRHLVDSSCRVEQAKRLAKILSDGLEQNLAQSTDEKTCSESTLLTSYVLIESLISLTVPDRAARTFLSGYDVAVAASDVSKALPSSTVLCERHGTPAKLLQFSVGEEKGRMFYACNPQDKNQCHFFAWSDAESLKCASSLFNEEIASYIWSLLSIQTHDGNTILVRLQLLVEKLLDESRNASPSQLPDSRFKSNTVWQDTDAYVDGVFCSRSRLQDVSPNNVTYSLIHSHQSTLSSLSDYQKEEKVVLYLLELLNLVANAKIANVSSWFPIICRLLVPVSKLYSKFRNKDIQVLAKRTLIKLCDDNETLAKVICDHFVFVFCHEELVNRTKNIMRQCVILNEKARCRGEFKKQIESTDWKTLSIANIVGTAELISEDIATVSCNESCSKILTNILRIAKKRCENWRRFCSIPFIRLTQVDADEDEFLSHPPMYVLFALASSLNNRNQIKVLKLLDIAFSYHEASMEKNKTFDSRNIISFEGEMLQFGGNEPFPLFGIHGSSPEDIINLQIDDIYTFAIRFICHGSLAEVRSVASKIAIKLCSKLDPTSLARLFESLIGSPLNSIGIMGKANLDLFHLLQSISKIPQLASVLNVSKAAHRIYFLYESQILAMRYDSMNNDNLYFDLRSNASGRRKRFDLTNCFDCCSMSQKEKGRCTMGSANVEAEESRLSSTQNVNRPGYPRSQLLSNKGFALSKCRLDTSRGCCTSNAFCSFFNLKHRLMLSAINLEINDPRGRFVKKINLYFLPRPVVKTSLLKTADFEALWQSCGEVIIPRGANKVSIAMAVKGKPTPVIASALKVEYADFYERPGSSKNDDGISVVHCPRCTRAVTSSHGVCGNCGEVAYQCRKCRHINYDRLDAFLCVECGHCASGSFQYEIVHDVASNAIAVTNDCDYDRMKKMSMAAARVREDLRTLLQRKLRVIQKNKRSEFEDACDDFLGRTKLERAYDGCLPGEIDEVRNESELARLFSTLAGKGGNVLKMIAHSNDQYGDQSHPLSRFTRHIRGESLTSRRTSDSLMIRHLGSTLGDDESATEFIGGLLERSRTLSRIAVLDPSDPLSRLLASVQSRRERRDAEDRDRQLLSGESGTEVSPCQKEDNALNECEAIYVMMREAELEFFNLEKCSNAWYRIERGSLADFISSNMDSDPYFEPSHCTTCAGSLALSLLRLWLSIFQLDPKSVEITKELVSNFLDIDSAFFVKSLREAKRNALTKISLYSEKGRPVVLEALRQRVTLFQDKNAAEIIGKILEAESEFKPAIAPFIALARDVLLKYDLSS